MGGEREADLKTEDFHLHHLHLEALSLLNVYAWGERQSRRVNLGRGTLLVGETRAIHSGGRRALVKVVRGVEFLRFRNVVRLLIAGLRGKTGEVESSTRSCSMRNAGRVGANTAGAQASEERRAGVLLRYGHREGIGRKSGLVERYRRLNGLHERSITRGKTTREEEGMRK